MADSIRERGTIGKIALDGTVRILAVERYDANTIRLRCRLVLPANQHPVDADVADRTFITSVWKQCGPGIVYSDAAFDDLERQLRELIAP